VRAILTNKSTKVAVFLLCCGPLFALAWRAFHRGLADFPNNMDLGANPIEFITHATGLWTLRFLVITLSITPLRSLLGLPDLIRFRRMLGLFAFFYACLHFVTYIWLDQFFDLHSIWRDIAKRPFITIGFLAFVLLIPLAITSTAGWIRRLGGRRWRILHRAIYISAVAGVIHYYWLVKSAVIPPLTYGAIVGILLLWRLGTWLWRRSRQGAMKTGARPEISGAAQ
jgi:sulfoxide reductase heme-binding subunit YedZ